MRRTDATRWLAAGLVLVGLFALLGGSQRPTSLTPFVMIGGDGVRDVRVAADRVYVLRQLDLNYVDVDAYRLRDGSRIWTSRLDSPAELVDVGDDRVVVNGSEPGATESTVLIGLDAANGAPVWRRSGYAPAVYRIGGASGVVVADPFIPRLGPDGVPVDDQPDEAQPSIRRSRQLIGIDMRTGTARWSLVTPAGTIRTFLFNDSDPVTSDTLGLPTIGRRFSIGELAPDGTLTVRSGDDASVERTAKIDMPAHVDGFDVSGDRLIAYEAGQDFIPSGAVYDLRTGHRIWTLPSSAVGGPVWWCGSVMCSGTESSISVLDPDTGRVRWTLDEWAGLQPFGGRMLATRVDRPVGELLEGALIVDPDSGKVLRQVVGWQPIGPQAWPDLVVARRTAKNGNALIGLLNVDTGSVTVFGRAERWYAPPSCFTADRFLICRNSQVFIWRLPS